jgi:hypothetical protein
MPLFEFSCELLMLNCNRALLFLGHKLWLRIVFQAIPEIF